MEKIEKVGRNPQSWVEAFYLNRNCNASNNLNFQNYKIFRSKFGILAVESKV